MKITYKKLIVLFIGIISISNLMGQDLPASINMKSIPGGTFTMGSATLAGNEEQRAAAPEHSVTLSPYSLSEAEITNAEYVEFLNAVYTEGLIKIVTGTMGPDNGLRLIQGTNTSGYNGKTLYTLDGTRVMKDHDDSDLDSNEWTGVIEPENPLNISYIGFDDATNEFYVKDPLNVNDFDWLALCDYQDWGTVARTKTGPVLNDFDDWAGAGNNYSNELEGWTAENPAAAVNMPTQSDVADWPVTFIRWWGAKAFVDYYGVTLPTEAQWEFAAKGGDNFQFAVHDGVDVDDANWNTTGLGTVAYHHVRSAISGNANPFGLYNLAGNAWEWILDNYAAPYSTDPVIDPLYEDGSTSRCWRGGSWNYHEATLQSAFRHKDDEARGNDHFGFRIAGPEITVGIEEGLLDYKIYPNPVENFVVINMNATEEQSVSVYNAIGSLIYQNEFTGNLNINTANWENGLYIMEINGTTKKLIKK